MFLGLSSSLMFSSFGDILLAFSPSLTVASRLLHPYSKDDKTSRLMVKQFSTVKDTQRDSQSYIEKRRGRVKKGESNLASNQFPKCFLQLRTPRKIHRIK